MSESETNGPVTGARRMWLLALDVPKGQLEPWKHPVVTEDGNRIWPLEDALGAALDADFVEVFDTSDIREFGLARYLAEANGFAAAMNDRARLDALSGPMVLVLSRAFDGPPPELAPKPPLRLVASFDEAADTRLGAPLRSDAARGSIPAGAGGPSAPAAGPGRGSGLIWAGLAALVILAAVIWGVR